MNIKLLLFRKKQDKQKCSRFKVLAVYFWHAYIWVNSLNKNNRDSTHCCFQRLKMKQAETSNIFEIDK